MPLTTIGLLTGYAQPPKMLTVKPINNSYSEITPMEPTMTILFIALVFAFVAVAAVGWGVDSRPTFTDDHAR